MRLMPMLIWMGLVTGTAFGQYGYRNPYYQNPYYQNQPFQAEDYNQKMYEDTKRNLEKMNMDMKLNAMQQQLNVLYAKENMKKHEEDLGLFLNGERFPKGKVIEPGIFQSDNYIWIKMPGTGQEVAYELQTLSKKIVKYDAVLCTANMFSFEVNIKEIDEAMKKQEIGPYAEAKEEVKNKGKVLLRK